jgi:hypothetical protein
MPELMLTRTRHVGVVISFIVGFSLAQAFTLGVRDRLREERPLFHSQAQTPGLRKSQANSGASSLSQRS